jgi:glycylpeptide N-tetradecanoyltransferase
LHVGVKGTGKDNLLAFISATPRKAVINENTVKMADVNFMCVHKKLRNKKLAPILMKEIKRRLNLQNIWSGVYTSGDVFPHPFAQAPYFHRSLNAKKNVETGFSVLPQNEPLARYVKRMKLHGLMQMDLKG